MAALATPRTALDDEIKSIKALPDPSARLDPVAPPNTVVVATEDGAPAGCA